MSIKVMNLIWEAAPYRGNTLLTFLALGDWADDEGLCWPHMETLATKSRQSRRGAQYSIDELVAGEMVTVTVNPGRGNQNEFRINVQKLHLLLEAKRCKTRQENVQSATGKRAKRDSAIRKNRQEPLRTVMEDSSCLKCGGKGTWTHKGHPGVQIYCWCPAGLALQRREQRVEATA